MSLGKTFLVSTPPRLALLLAALCVVLASAAAEAQGAEAQGVAATVAILHPFTTFDDNQQYYDDKQSTTYYANVWTAVIKNFEEHSIIPAGKVTADDVVWGGPIWQQMVDYRTKTDEILKKLAGATLTPDKQKLVDQAKTFYADYDFLDAYRLALAASS